VNAKCAVQPIYFIHACAYDACEASVHGSNSY